MRFDGGELVTFESVNRGCYFSYETSVFMIVNLYLNVMHERCVDVCYRTSLSSFTLEEFDAWRMGSREILN